jgi:hypothetical protein
LNAKPQLSTPRLREYFPETLLWRPEVITDSRGRAQVKFPLADTLTTWKMQVVASTVDGRIATADKTFQTFQPFFAELDPPRILTQGDEIALPVVLRNYLNRSLAVELTMKSEDWLQLLGPATQRSQLAPRESKREVFSFRAGSSITDGNQRVDAIAASASDAIQKKVTVHPDGQERVRQVSSVFLDHGSLEAILPADAIAGSAQAQLKIYPNLMAYVVESIEAILQRPYGCAEQTISSTYPSLLLLRALQKSPVVTSPLRQRAERNLRLGYERLLGYRAPGGGFTYWGRGEADLALSAYALRFLQDARGFTVVDDSVSQETLNWLLNQARPDGSWAWHDWQGREVEKYTLSLTAYIARTLAEMQLSAAEKLSAAANDALSRSVAAALSRSLGYLGPHVSSSDNPYLIATYALAAYGAARPATAAPAVARLRKLVHDESGVAYWNLEQNTLFYGWGLAGRIETTALVLQALAAEGSEPRDGQDSLISRGLLFVLKNQDRFGVWHSTQTTVTVTQALIAIVSSGITVVAGNSSAPAELLVNGQMVKTIALPPPNELSGPIYVDLSGRLAAGANRVEIRRPGAVARSSVQLVLSYYVPWADSADEKSSSLTGRSEALRYAVHFNRVSARPDEPVECTVEAERIGFRGYGMMLAEIGLPPGAQVDRESLDRAMASLGWDANKYEVLPDRVVLYLWPRAGGSKFVFTFRPRYGMRAKAASSSLYDYYNPEASVVLSPPQFTIH